MLCTKKKVERKEKKKLRIFFKSNFYKLCDSDFGTFPNKIINFLIDLHVYINYE